jgi:hypothetical protein
MKSIRSIVRPVAVAVALAFALCAAPVTAFAGDRAPAAETKKDQRRFPMKAESFNKLIEKRIAHMREHLSRTLAARKVPEAKQAQIKKDFEDGAASVRAAAARASADGTVTKEEAKEVRGLARDLRGKAHEKRQPGKANGRGRDHDKKRGDVS